jgi:hypothetical protein
MRVLKSAKIADLARLTLMRRDSSATPQPAY